MQKVVHLTLCDVCLYRGEQRAAEHSEVVRVGQVERLLETCHEHRAELLGDLAERLRRYGQEVPAGHRNGERSDLAAKPKRKRRTKVEMEAARALAAAESAGQDGPAPEVGAGPERLLVAL